MIGSSATARWRTFLDRAPPGDLVVGLVHSHLDRIPPVIDHLTSVTDRWAAP